MKVDLKDLIFLQVKAHPILLLTLNETLSFIPSTKNFLSSEGFITLQPEFPENSSLPQKRRSVALNFLRCNLPNFEIISYIMESYSRYSLP